jgi:glycerol-3-phosphate dehydrogenase
MTRVTHCLLRLQIPGIFTSPAAAKWAQKLQLDLPIIQAVAKV